MWGFPHLDVVFVVVVCAVIVMFFNWPQKTPSEKFAEGFHEEDKRIKRRNKTPKAKSFDDLGNSLPPMQEQRRHQQEIT